MNYSTRKSLRIFIADRRPEVRSALRLLLENQDKHWNVIGEAADIKGLQAFLGHEEADLVLLDWSLLELVETNQNNLLPSETIAILRRSGKCRVIATGCCNDEYNQAQAAGVDAFISKVEPPENIISTLKSTNFKWCN